MDERRLTPFHLAVLVDDLDAARTFYGDLLGCPAGRSSGSWADFDFFGHQLVCHQLPGERPPASSQLVDGHGVPVPHFGVVLPLAEWEALRSRLEAAGVGFRVDPHVRFAGQPGEQHTFFITDPAGNALEFKGFRGLDALFAVGSPR
ncbi:MAG: VOC family protein [Chromatiales bacterium]|nr:VOC family protein [Chromatiales bacterium]